RPAGNARRVRSRPVLPGLWRGHLFTGGCFRLLFGGPARLFLAAALLDLAQGFLRDVGDEAVDRVRMPEAAGPASVAVAPVPPLVIAVAEAGDPHHADEQVPVGPRRGREMTAV